jgi:cytochrome P450
VSKAFTSTRIKDLEPRIREFTAALLDRVACNGEFEVMADLANPLPVMVIAEMLGVSQDDYEQFKQWSDNVVESDMVPPGVEMPEYIINAFQALRAYFIDEIGKRRRNPGSDLISALVAARDEADALSEEELIAFVVLLLLAGNETTTNLIGNGMLALGRNPDQLAKLRGDLSLMPRALEEMLRYDGPVQSTARYPKVDMEISGVQIVANTPTFVIIAAANRDPAQFPDSYRFDITRTPNDHLAFGNGIHYCLGAPLARMEAGIALSEVSARFPHARLDSEPQYKANVTLRGLSELTVAV